MAWSDPEHEEVLQALAVVCEVTGANYSQPARLFLLRELETYGALEVLAALRRCARECTHKLVLVDVIKRIDEEHEKQAASRRALASIEETRYRLECLEKGIPWESAKLALRKLSQKQLTPAVSRPVQKHWTDTDDD